MEQPVEGLTLDVSLAPQRPAAVSPVEQQQSVACVGGHLSQVLAITCLPVQAVAAALTTPAPEDNRHNDIALRCEGNTELQAVGNALKASQQRVLVVVLQLAHKLLQQLWRKLQQLWKKLPQLSQQRQHIWKKLLPEAEAAAAATEEAAPDAKAAAAAMQEAIAPEAGAAVTEEAEAPEAWAAATYEAVPPEAGAAATEEAEAPEAWAAATYEAVQPEVATPATNKAAAAEAAVAVTGEAAAPEAATAATNEAAIPEAAPTVARASQIVPDLEGEARSVVKQTSSKNHRAGPSSFPQLTAVESRATASGVEVGADVERFQDLLALQVHHTSSS